MKLKEYLPYQLIDNLIKNNIHFALYRLPQKNIINLVIQKSDKSTIINNLTDLNNVRGFVIAPFHISESCPIVLINPDVFISGDEEIFRYLHNHSFENDYSDSSKQKDKGINTFEKYNSRYVKFHDKLTDNTFRKLVLSRTLDMKQDNDFSASITFYRACEKYPDNFIFLCNSTESGAWLGSSPEILLSGIKNNWNTVALAGTQRLTDDTTPIYWDAKNILEQQIVAEYMKTQLSKAGIKSIDSQPMTIKSGNLAHLKSVFNFNLKGTTEIGDLLKLLHPSPAVCGLPKQDAFNFILENEGYDRRYYSGFLGYLDKDTQTDLFVNLRCMQIFEDSLRLFAGGGLLISSDAKSEWEETEYKLQTILSIIKNTAN